MPNETPGQGRMCPSCGRRVPRAIQRCRCGVEMPAEANTVLRGDAVNPRGPSPGMTIIVGAIGLAALVTAGYWAFTQEPSQAANKLEVSRPVPRARPVSREQPTAAAASDSAPPASGARRAWEASIAIAETNAAKTTATPAPAALTAPPSSSESNSLEDVVSRVMPAVVLVEASRGTGSAFFVRADTLLTNVHVVESDSFVKLRRLDGTTVSARVDSRAPAYDIAVLKISPPAANQTVIPMGSADVLRAGQEVFTIGSALGTLQNSVTRGIVSGVRRSGNVRLVQNDAAANPGNSGGPLLDRSGTAIGITTMGYRNQQGLNFAVAIDHAKAILDGKAPALPAATGGIADLKELSPGIQSETERVRNEGERMLSRTLDSLADGANRLDAEWSRFRQGCLPSPVGGAYQHEWFAVLVPGAINPSTLRGSCFSFHSDFTQEAKRFHEIIRKALDGARRAGLEPGEVREALRARRLDFDGWDR